MEGFSALVGEVVTVIWVDDEAAGKEAFQGGVEEGRTVMEVGDIAH